MSENLAAKYRPRTFSDVTEQSIVVDIVKNICTSGDISNRNFLFTGSAGCGKAQPCDSLVLTPEGYVEMGDITAGDKVFTRYGEVAEVTDIFPQGVRPIYTIHLSDGSHVRVADNHLNLVYQYINGQKREYVLDTMELIDRCTDCRSDQSYYIDNVIINNYSDVKPLRMNPYLAGLLCAGSKYCPDGKFTINLRMEIDTAELAYILKSDYGIDLDSFSKESIEPALINKFECHIPAETPSFTYQRGFSLLLKHLEECKSLASGAIHYEVAFQQLEYRREFIRGYGDGLLHVGHAVTNSVVSSNVLSNLLRSSGYIDHTTTLRSRGKTKTMHDFREANYTGVKRKIVSIVPDGQEECKCIYVDDPDHTYVTDYMIPTHNTTIARIIANELNEGKGEPIEIDAASHGSVEAVREIVSQARTYPVGSNWKVFIIDECFAGDTLVRTTAGIMPIKNVHPGHHVYNMTGEAAVKAVHQNTVRVDNLMCVNVGGQDIITTKDHLFFTDEGWVPAKLLKEGDNLYDYKDMQILRQRIQSTGISNRSILQQGVQVQASIKDQHRETLLHFGQDMSNMWKEFLDVQVDQCEDLWSEVRSRVQEEASKLGEIERVTFETLAYVYMSHLQQNNGDSCERSQDSLLQQMFCRDVSSDESQDSTSRCDKAMRILWKNISDRVEQAAKQNMQQGMSEEAHSLQEQDPSSINLFEEVRRNEAEQSGIKTGSTSQNQSYSNSQRKLEAKACYALWERVLFSSTDSFEESIGERMGIRICNPDKSREEQSNEVSYELQSRPCLIKNQTSDRGGWDRPLYESAVAARRKESPVLTRTRVDSIQSYKRGCNEGLFQSHFPDTPLCDAEYVIMYDLEVEGHPSYFVEDTLVHNCHAVSNTAWQAFLKAIEEQPARSIFMFCTTNPEKIPATVLSRVQTFQLSKISLDGIYQRLKYIIDCEIQEGRQIEADDDAIRFLAKLAEGGMRNGITLLDKTLSYSNKVTLDVLQKSLGLPNYDKYFELLNAIAKKDNETIISIINDVYNSGLNFVKWFEGFFGFITNIVKYIYLKDISQTIIPVTYQDKIQNYGPAHTVICLKLSNTLLKMNYELKSSQYLQEIAISYLCTLPQVKK